MVSNNGLINRYESNRLIFKTFETKDAFGNITTDVGFAPMANKKQQVFERNLFEDTLVKQRQDLERFNLVYNETLNDVGDSDKAFYTARDAIADADDATKRYVETNGKGAVDIKEFEKSQRASFEASEKASKGLKGLSSSTKAMFKNIGASLLTGFAINMALKGLDVLNNKFKLTKEARADAMESTISDYDKATSTANDNIKTIKSLRDEYNELSKGIGSNGENLSLTAEQYDRYNEIANQLAEMNPKLVRGYTLEGNAIIDRNNAIKEGIEAQEEYAKSATKQYLAGGSDIYGGVKDQLIANKKEMSATAANISNMLGGVQKTGHAYGRSGKTTGAEYNDVINKALGKQIDLENASAETLREVAQNKEKILATAIETNGWNQAEKDDLKKINDLNEDLLKMSNQASLYEDAAQPMIDYLNAWVANKDEAGKMVDDVSQSILNKIPESLRQGYQSGLKQIALREDLGLDGMIVEANNLADSLSKIYESNTGGYATALNEAKKAQQDFMDSDKSKADVEKYNATVEEQIGILNKLAKKYRAVGDEFTAAALEAQALEIDNFGQENIMDLERAFNPLVDSINEARKAKENFDAAMAGGDYNTAINAYEEIYDDVMDGFDNAGNGTKAFWTAAEQMLGADTLKEYGYDIDKINAKMRSLNGIMGDSEASTDNFYRMLRDNAGELNKLVKDENGNFKELVSIADSGAISFDIDSTDLDEVADKLNISKNLLVAMIDNARHWSDIDLSDDGSVETAIRDMDGTFTNGDKAYQLMDKVGQAAAAAGLNVGEVYRKCQDLENIELIDLTLFDDKETIASAAQQLIDMNSILGSGDASKGFKMNADAIISQMKTMGATADQTANVLEQLDQKGWIKEGTSNKGADQSYFDYTNSAFNTLDESDPFVQMANSTDKVVEGINQIILALGGIPTDISFTSNVDEINQKITGLQTSETYSAKDKQRIQDKIDSQRSYYEKIKSNAETDKTLTKDQKIQITATADDALAELDKCQKSLDKLPDEKKTKVDADTDSAQKNIDKVAKSLGAVDGKEVTAECNTIVKNEDKLDNFKDFLGKNGANSKEIEIAVNAITKGANGDLEGFINEFDKLPDDVQKEFALYFKTDGDPEAQKEAYNNAPDEDKNTEATTYFGIKGDPTGQLGAWTNAPSGTKDSSSTSKFGIGGDPTGQLKAWGNAPTGAKLASSVAEFITRKITEYVTRRKDESKAEGTPGRRVFSSAAYGKAGSDGRGGLTLTGELGPELVWLPSKSESMIVGQYGPEMVNLPADAVVYPANETRRIVGSSLNLPRPRFGSMVGGTKILSSGSGSGSGSGSRTGSNSGSNSKSKKKSAAEKKIDKYESKKEKLDHLLEMEYISESTYYKKLKALYKKYLKNTKGAAKERRQSLEDQRKAWLDAYEAEKEYYENRYERGLMSDEAYYKKMKALGKKYLTQNGKVRKGYAKEYRDWLAEMNDLRSDTFDKLQEDLDKKLEKGLISTEKYLKESKKLQSKYLWTAGLKDEKADAIEEMYENIKDGLDKQWDDILQKIDDNELFGVWTENSPEAIALMQQFYDQLAKDGRKYFATEKEYNEYLLELKRQIAETQKDIYNDQQSDLESLLDLVESMIRQEAEDHIDSLEKQKEAYEEIIDAKKKSIELTERELDFQDKLNDYAKDEAKLKSQIETLALDDSREALAKRIELEEELAQLQEERNREVRDETIDRTTDRLDEQAELYGKMIDKQIEIVENWLNNKAAVLEVVADTVAQRETNNLLERLIAYNGEHGDAMLSTVNKAWADINSLAEEYGNDINKIVEALQKGIDVNITGGIISKDQTDYADTQEETKKHHSGIAAGFTGNGADTKQHEVYRLLTDDELVFNREDQMRIASQLQVLDTIKSSYASLAKGVNNQVITPRPSVDLTINAPITIEGNASSEVVGQIEKALENTTNTALNKLENALRINGVRTRASSNMRKG